MTHDQPLPIPTVAIVGGGFCGAMCAVHLLRDHPGLTLRLDVIEPRPVLGAGLAYSTTDPEHRINVAAARMSPLPEDDLHLDRWLRDSGIAARDPRAVLPDGRVYAQRAEVGRYVASLLRDSVRTRPDVAFRHIRQRATAARAEPGGFAIALQDGTHHHADVLVLAVGHPPPLLPAVLRPWVGDARLVADPWDQAALDSLPRAEDLLIVGTGLTACDVVASLRARGHVGKLTAVSRRGLLPRPRTLQPVEAEGDFSTQPARSARALLRGVRRAVAATTQAGRPWENVIDALRRQGREVWAGLPPSERRRFLRHLRAFWDVHRYQAAPQIADLVARERETGRLEVLAASLRSVVAEDGAWVAHLRPRRSDQTVQRRIGGVIACVGPGHASVVATNPVLHTLATAGLLQADAYGLGIAVDAQSRCIDANGQARERLLVAGPLARGTEGELMGLPQVSTQPREVAGRAAALLRAGRTSELPAGGRGPDRLLVASSDVLP